MIKIIYGKSTVVAELSEAICGSDEIVFLFVNPDRPYAKPEYKVPVNDDTFARTIQGINLTSMRNMEINFNTRQLRINEESKEENPNKKSNVQ